MSELDDLFNNSATKASNSEKSSFNKEDWLKQKADTRNAAFKMLDEGTKALSNPDIIETYIDVQSKFDRYSASNAILIAYQCPEATRLADFDTWKKQGVSIKKGEQGIVILEPGKEYKKKDGSSVVPYNAKKVFDISQTDSKQKDYSSLNVKDYKTAILLLNRTSSVPISISSDLSEGVNARYDSKQKQIYVRQGMTGEDLFRNLSREIAFSKLDNGNYNRSPFAFQAICVSSIICKRIGVPAKPITALECKSFIGLAPKDKRSELNKVREIANGICTNYFKEQSNLTKYKQRKNDKER